MRPRPEAGLAGAVWSWLDPDEPRPLRGPFARWPRVTDGLLAAVVFIGTLVAVAASIIDETDGLTIGSIGDRPAGALALLAVASVSLWWRRRYPIAVIGLILVCLVGWAVAGYGDGQDLPLVIALYSVGRHAISQRHSLAVVATALAVSVIGSVVDSTQRIDIAPALLITVLPWYVGRQLRNRGDYLALLKERAERLRADQQARARRAVASERARIARELHDVVAHQVSMMTVQAGAAKMVARSDPDAAIEAMGDVERAGRKALGELRHLLGVLRAEPTAESGRVPTEADDLGPQPGLAGIGDLAAELTYTGAEVSLDLTDRSDDLTVALQMSVYRIVQEAVTNIVRHAGPNPTVAITVDRHEQAVTVDITNTISSPTDETGELGMAGGDPSGLPVSGYGIIGMRERATMLGGTLQAGLTGEPGRYRVTANLPLQPEPR